LEGVFACAEGERSGCYVVWARAMSYVVGGRAQGAASGAQRLSLCYRTALCTCPRLWAGHRLKAVTSSSSCLVEALVGMSAVRVAAKAVAPLLTVTGFREAQPQ